MAEYLTIPTISTYSKISPERLNNPKENFKLAASIISELSQSRDASIHIADVGCANGELVHYLRSQFPSASLHGFDREDRFISVANSLEIPNATFSVADLRNIEASEAFDFVICVGTVPIFHDPAEVLLPLLSICKPGGYVLADGFFNPHECEVRIQFCDNSTEAGRGKWRADFTQHSRTLIREVLSTNCDHVEFRDIEMGVDIPKGGDVPHARVWTFKDETGRRRITSGLNVLLDGTMLIARKA